MSRSPRYKDLSPKGVLKNEEMDWSVMNESLIPIVPL